MTYFKEQFKAFIMENKFYLILLFVYTLIMTSVLGKSQSDVPFISVKNFFSNNNLVATIFLVQAVMLIATFFKNAAKARSFNETYSKRYIISNIIICVIFSIISSIFVVFVFFISIFLTNTNGFINLHNMKLYYFGVMFNGINYVALLKMFIYGFSGNMVIMAISSLLESKNIKWFFGFIGAMLLILIINIAFRNQVIAVYSEFFEAYGSPYLLSIIFMLISFGILFYNWLALRGQNQYSS